jgi:hypothetical protein
MTENAIAASRARAALRRLLEEPSDQRVRDRTKLLEALDGAVAHGEARRQIELGRALAAKAKEIQAAEADQRAAMAAALDRAREAVGPEERVERLVEAFATCALIQVVAEDDFGDHETVDRAIEMKHTIAAALDAIGDGARGALAALLDSPFAGVRASAGAHLLNAGLLRERVIPLLQVIEQDVWGSAGWTAFWALAPDDHGAWLSGDLLKG